MSHIAIDHPDLFIPEFRVIIAGGRDFNNLDLLTKECDYLLGQKVKTHNIVVVSGKAPGADTLGEKYALLRRFRVMPFPALWNDLTKEPCKIRTRTDGTKFNLLAGLNRNKDMANYVKEVKDGGLIACWNSVSKGTLDMITVAEQMGIPTRVIKY